MLGPGRYLLGIADLALLLGFAWLGASRVRSRLLPSFEGAPAHLVSFVLAAALLIWTAEILGTLSLFKPLPYVAGVVVVGVGIWWFDGLGGRRGGAPSLSFALPRRPGRERAEGQASGSKASGLRKRPHPAATQAGEFDLATLVALVIAAVAVIHFAGGVKTRLSTGMTGFDSTWYHGPFAAGFFQSGNTIDLHFIAPQFLAWFYPANGEIFHAIGMGAFGRDVLSPLLNLGWFVGCLVACWCIGRPYRVQAWSLGLGAIALSVPALADQAGEARNDIVGIFFLLAAVAVALNAWGGTRDEQLLGKEEGDEGVALSLRPWPGAGALVVVGLAAGLAAGTKLNFLLPAAVLVVGLALIAPRGHRWSALWVAALAALAGGGYWYLRNLIHAGNPLPWIHHLGPITLPAPEQALGGREANSVLGYLTDGTVWSDWFFPGLHQALWIVWPLLGAAALAGLVLCLVPMRGSFGTPEVPKEPRIGGGKSCGSLGTAAVSKEPWDGKRWDPVLVIAGLVGLASALAWLIAPTSASGPDGMPKGFESGLRYLTPALILGLALLPTVPLLRYRLSSLGTRLSFPPHREGKLNRAPSIGRPWAVTMGLVLLLVAVVCGYPIQRHYLQKRYADPSFTTPGLNAAFAWSRDISHARIATTSTRQYPLFGTDLSNHVQFIGSERPHGGFEAPTSCREWREELNKGHYDYAVTSKDRIEPGKPPYPQTTRWTESPQAEVVLRKPPTVVFKLTGPLNPSSCPS
jgi:hypothetical protein